MFVRVTSMPNTPRTRTPRANARVPFGSVFGKVFSLRPNFVGRRPARSGLWHSASGKPEHARNEERNQGHDEHDLRRSERGSSDDAEAERASDQSNDKKAIAQLNMVSS